MEPQRMKTLQTLRQGVLRVFSALIIDEGE